MKTKLIRSIIVFMMTILMLLTGCAPNGPATPAELDRAREVLDETSPRNLNDHPKAVQNLRYRFDSEPKPPCAECD